MTDVTPFLDAYEREEMTCRVHGAPFMRRDGKMGVFYSCGQKFEDGTWCNVRPNPALVESIEQRLTSNNRQPQ